MTDEKKLWNGNIAGFSVYDAGEDLLNRSIWISVKSDGDHKSRSEVLDHKSRNRPDIRTIYDGLGLTPKFGRSIFMRKTLILKVCRTIGNIQYKTNCCFTLSIENSSLIPVNSDSNLKNCIEC